MFFPWQHTVTEGRWSVTQEFLAYAIIRARNSRVTDDLPFVPVCCHDLALQVERSLGNRTKLRFACSSHKFLITNAQKLVQQNGWAARKTSTQPALVYNWNLVRAKRARIALLSTYYTNRTTGHADVTEITAPRWTQRSFSLYEFQADPAMQLCANVHKQQ